MFNSLITEVEPNIQGTHPYPSGPGIQLADGTTIIADPSQAGMAMVAYENR